jgi:16S rRNA (cytidine1402-2'-O)-methyltransferase
MLIRHHTCIRNRQRGRSRNEPSAHGLSLEAVQDTIVKTGILYVVSTPIGNLDDITVRAIEALRTVDLIACEDTRKSRILLERLQASTKLVSLHKFSETSKAHKILESLAQGQDVALISDAGTPAISDPGHRLVRAAQEAGFIVSPIPGPSSITAALSVSGMDCSTFVYLGFAPRKDEQRRRFFSDIAAEKRTCVFFETPHRIEATLRAATDLLGSRRVALFRELTKLHEEIILGTATDIHATLVSRESVKGEIIVLVEGASEIRASVDLDEAVLILMSEGLSGTRLASEARVRFGLKKSEAYETYLRMKEATNR